MYYNFSELSTRIKKATIFFDESISEKIENIQKNIQQKKQNMKKELSDNISEIANQMKNIITSKEINSEEVIDIIENIINTGENVKNIGNNYENINIKNYVNVFSNSQIELKTILKELQNNPEDSRKIKSLSIRATQIILLMSKNLKRIRILLKSAKNSKEDKEEINNFLENIK